MKRMRRVLLAGVLVAALSRVVTVCIAIAISAPEGGWASPWTHAGGAATVGLMIAFWARGLPGRSRRLQLKDGVIV